MTDYSGFQGHLSVTEFKNYLLLNVAEVVFVRRRKPKDPSVTSKTRRIVCTINQLLLNSPFGLRTLKYKPAHQTPPYNAEKKGLVTVWDCLVHEWRNIDVKSAVIIRKESPDSLPMNVNSEKGIQEFAKFYNAKLARMNMRQFMDK